MNTVRFTRFVFVLATFALIVGLSACDQIQGLLLPAPPQMEGLSGEIPLVSSTLPPGDSPRLEWR